MDTVFFEVRLARKCVEALDIVTLELEALAAPLPGFRAGAHIDLQISPGLVRQYSLCNNPREQHRYVIGVLCDPQSRGGSAAVHAQLHEGQTLRISAPRNHFALVEGRPALLLAGGIGVTPLLCMAEQMSNSGRRFEMHYCARSPERMAFRQRIGQAPFAARVHLHYDDGAAEQQFDLPQVLAAQSADTELYVCGPAGFIEFVLRGAEAAGWAPERVHYEYFAGKALGTGGDRAFEVQLASTGAVYPVGEDESIVEALSAHGVGIATSCQQGICGACMTRVLDGQPDHRDQVLSEQERREQHWFTPCCSRAHSARLVLDL